MSSERTSLGTSDAWRAQNSTREHMKLENKALVPIVQAKYERKYLSEWWMKSEIGMKLARRVDKIALNELWIKDEKHKWGCEWDINEAWK